MRIREILASLRHNNAVPAVQALAARQFSIADIWEQRWFYGDFNRLLAGPLEAQALQCLVEAIVGELDALSGTLDGTQGHEAAHLDAELTAHSSLHRALQDLRKVGHTSLAIRVYLGGGFLFTECQSLQGVASGFWIMSLSHACSALGCHGIDHFALLCCFLLAVNLPV
ncbi:hypothetical protein ABBQ32_008010 [Trebouxia sp. C0010 RCD-2024]